MRAGEGWMLPLLGIDDGFIFPSVGEPFGCKLGLILELLVVGAKEDVGVGTCVVAFVGFIVRLIEGTDDGDIVKNGAGEG